MKLSKIFQAKQGTQEQLLDLNCSIHKRSQLDELGYEDFKADVFINGKHIGNIAPVLLNSGALFKMVDEVNWFEIMNAKQTEKKEAVYE